MSDQHPDVLLAIAHRKERESQEERREREHAQAIDLQPYLWELAKIVTELCAASIADAPYLQDRASRQKRHERARALEERLS